MLETCEIRTSAQMRAIESRMIGSGAVSGVLLMERAGKRVVEAILAQWPDLVSSGDRSALVLCGSGNNGGDGFVIARLLSAMGWRVEVLLADDPTKLRPDARLNHDRWRAIGGVFNDPTRISRRADLAVDALLGIGLDRPIDPLAPFIAALRTASHLVAVDIPSGLCADSGRVISRSCTPAAADLTVTFHCKKPGHLLGQGPLLCGHVVVADIGLPQAPSHLRQVIGADLAKRQGHKFDHGHALIIAGGRWKGGAARLSARSALRIGAGLVTICPPADALAEHAGPPDALMRHPLDDASDLAATLRDDRISAICIGPGCGVDRAAALLPVVLRSGRPAVLDGDAITALSQRRLPFQDLHPACILTPHAGEFARLFPDVAEQLKEPVLKGPACSRIDAASEAAARSSAVVLLKGPDTVIADPSGRVLVHSAADLPWLATAGAGDVLAGLIVGLLARGFATPDAAAAAVLAHATAARNFGPGLIADDLPEAVPAALRVLQARLPSRA
ncbi:NAD(P)H-hydrate dehydratase [Paracoccus beibuensis]|uniref:NAD(P)H-hydrate dehydratase n=1 Tax=Paracoccus beibuensis TaxID=547602 RepID=UPI00223F4362|nr:NAD(P)H-hydrate dehydratase [Paracoccus beibuensis]